MPTRRPRRRAAPPRRPGSSPASPNSAVGGAHGSSAAVIRPPTSQKRPLIDRAIARSEGPRSIADHSLTRRNAAVARPIFLPCIRVIVGPSLIRRGASAPERAVRVRAMRLLHEQSTDDGAGADAVPRRPLEPAPRGRTRPSRRRVRRARRQPARRPGSPAALRAATAGRRARPPAPAAGDLRDPGVHRSARHVDEPDLHGAELHRARGRDARLRRMPRRDRRHGRLLDLIRRLPVPRLDRHRQLPVLSLRRGRPVHRRALSDGSGPRPPRHHRQVVGRVRSDGRADDATRRLLGPRLPRRRRALRDVDDPRVRRRGPHPPGQLRELLRRLLRAARRGRSVRLRPVRGSARDVRLRLLLHAGPRPTWARRWSPSRSRPAS